MKYDNEEFDFSILLAILFLIGTIVGGVIGNATIVYTCIVFGLLSTLIGGLKK